MKNFTLIQSVFSSENERTLEKLSAIYGDIPFLKKIISELINGSFKEDDVKNK